jgi:hypothetical protein
VESSGSNPDGEISHRLIVKDSSNPFRDRDTYQRYSSDFCAALILFKYRHDAHSTLIDFFHDTSNVGQFGGLRGHMFEILAHPVIASGGPFRCRKLETRSPGRPSKSAQPAEPVFDISFAVNGVSHVNLMEESKNIKNQLVIPRSKNFESVDSWIIDDSNVASGFQFTVSKSHSITTSVYTYGELINLQKYYTVVYDDEVFKKFGYRSIQSSKKNEHKDSKECNIEQYVLQIPIPDKIELGMVLDQLKSQFEAFVPEPWSDRIKEEFNLAFNGALPLSEPQNKPVESSDQRSFRIESMAVSNALLMLNRKEVMIL